MKSIVAYLLLLLFTTTAASASDCNNGRYKRPLFPQVKRTNNIVYATKRQSDGLTDRLEI